MVVCNTIFDLDETLTDFARITAQIIDAMLAERIAGMVARRDLIKAMDAIEGVAMIVAVIGAHSRYPAADLDEFRHRHRFVDVPHDVLFQGVATVIAELSARGVDFAMSSNEQQTLYDKILGDLGIDTHFTIIVGDMPDRPRRLHPASALLALEAMPSDRQTALF